MLSTIVVVASLCALLAASSSGEEERYYGRLIGELTLRSHQVRGHVYAINATSFFINGFMYDGLGHDTYFFIGSGDGCVVFLVYV